MIQFLLIAYDRVGLPVSLASFQLRGRATCTPSALTAWMREGPYTVETVVPVYAPGIELRIKGNRK